MMETWIVILIVAAATVYVGRIFYKGIKQKDGRACGCTCCGISDSCSQPEAGKVHPVDPSQTDG